MKYGTVERREGDYGLQEVVKDYSPWIKTYGRFQLASLKIVRTPNSNRILSVNPFYMEGVDYRHRVYYSASVNGRKCYYPSYYKADNVFSDDQEGLDLAERFAEKVMFTFWRSRFNHPKTWSIIKQ